LAEERVCTIKLKDAKPDQVFARLAGIFGNVFVKSYKLGDHFFGIVVGEKYFLRIDSDVAIIAVVTGQEDSTNVDITAAGGKQGLILHWDIWSHEDFMRSVEKALAGEVEHKGILEQTPLIYGVDKKKLQTMLGEKKERSG
jgi:hypothetical protein